MRVISRVPCDAFILFLCFTNYYIDKKVSDFANFVLIREKRNPIPEMMTMCFRAFSSLNMVNIIIVSKRGLGIYPYSL